jgi:hypothetical protein
VRARVDPGCSKGVGVVYILVGVYNSGGMSASDDGSNI